MLGLLAAILSQTRRILTYGAKEIGVASRVTGGTSSITTFTQLVNHTGSGELMAVAFQKVSPQGAEIRVTIDGIVQTFSIAGGATGRLINTQSMFTSTLLEADTTTFLYTPLFLPFKSQLRIEYRVLSAGNPLTVHVQYASD